MCLKILLVAAIPGDNALYLPVVFTDNECAIFVNIDRIALETVFQGPDLDPVLKRARQAFPFLDDGIVLPAFQQKIPALKFPEDPCEERCPVHFMPELCAD